jgi:cytochrome c oxidase cbb3-type subunit 3
MYSRFPESLLIVALVLVASGCEREERRFSDTSTLDPAQTALSQSDIRAGGTPPRASASSPYDGNAHAISQGKQLYEWFNCNGCHAHGGGAIGPPLMDEKWVYGAEAENIYATIVEGRPNGMPSFRGRIPPQQVWQIVAYVRSMSGLVPKDVAPSRSDSLFTKKSEQSTAVGQPPPARSSPPPPASPPQ